MPGPDQAVRLMKELEALRTDAPEIPGIVDRVIARVCDVGLGLVLGVVIGLVCYVIQSAIWGAQQDNPEWNPGPNEVVFMCSFAGLWIAMLLANEAGAFGRGRQTLGMRVSGIQVVGEGEDGAVSAGRMLVRGLSVFVVLAVMFGGWVLAAWLLSDGLAASALALLGVVAIAVLVGRGGRGLHDRLWGTKLVRPR